MLIRFRDTYRGDKRAGSNGRVPLGGRYFFILSCALNTPVEAYPLLQSTNLSMLSTQKCHPEDFKALAETDNTDSVLR